MDFYKELEKIDKHIPTRDGQDIELHSGKSYHQKYPYKNTAHKTVGEHFPDINNKIVLLKYLQDHPTMPDHDQSYIKETLKFVDEYERKGMFLGVMSGIAMFFFPAIRRLAIYKRLPIAFIPVFLLSNWGYHYGRDLVLIKTRNLIENWERDVGIRHFQMSI